MLVHGIAQMFQTGKPAYPVERTLLTTGALAALMESAYQGHKRLETPHAEHQLHGAPRVILCAWEGLVRCRSSFEKLAGANPAPERIATGFRSRKARCSAGWDTCCSAISPSGRIMKWEAGKVTVFREKSNGAGGLTFDHQGRLLACEQGRVTRTEKNGAITVLADRCETVPLNHPNDIVYAIDGTIYFTDAESGALRCSAASTARARSTPLPANAAWPMALRWPRINRSFMWPTPAGANIRIYDISGDGSLKNGRLFAEARSNGLKTDEEGNIWATDGDAITVFDSRGTKLGSIAMPETPSNCAWGEGFRGLYVTARSSVYKLRANVNGTRTY